MKKGVLINDIELGCCPISAYNFNLLIRDKEFIKTVADSHLYVIAQRREVAFYNFNFPSPILVKFDIKQENNPDTIHCTLPLFQNVIANDYTKSVEMRLHNRKNKVNKKNEPPYNGTQGITFKEVNEINNEKKQLNWFTPEKLFLYYWRKYIKIDLIGNYSEMLKYQVLYVGKSTEQNICKRLSNHSTFQEILTKEETISYGNIPSNEIVILLLRINDNNTITKWDSDSSDEELLDYLSNYKLPSDKAVSIDAEKALIKYLQPEYNRVLYDSYPTNNDLLNNDIHSAFLYSFIDPITLVYKNGIIRGSSNIAERDFISVEKQE